MNSFGFIFSGQGSQNMHDALDVYSHLHYAKDVFSEIEDITEVPICDTIENELDKYIYDPHISSLLIFGYNTIIGNYISGKISPSAVAGYSIGQYSALYYAKSIEFETIVNLIHQRGLLLKKIINKNTCLVGIIGLASKTIKKKINQKDGVYITSYSSPSNHTIACKKKDLVDLIEGLEDLGAIKCTKINSSAAWHSPYVADVTKAFSQILEEVKILKPKYHFVDNTTGIVEKDPEVIRLNLVKHLTQPILWESSVRLINKFGITNFIEIGLGNHISQFVKFTNRKLKTYTTSPYLNLQSTKDKLTRLSKPLFLNE